MHADPCPGCEVCELAAELAEERARHRMTDIPSDIRSLSPFEMAEIVDELERAEERARYLQREINEMRRAMQDAGMWEAFCGAYAARKSLRAPEGDGDAD